MADEKPLPPAAPLKEMDVGDWVWVLFWRPWPMPGNDKNGLWNSVYARVVSVGKKLVAVEVSPNLPAYVGDGESTNIIRFIALDRLFASMAEAERYAVEQKLQSPA